MLAEQCTQRAGRKAENMERRKSWRQVDNPIAPAQTLVEIAHAKIKTGFVRNVDKQHASASKDARNLAHGFIRIIQMLKYRTQDYDIEGIAGKIALLDAGLNDFYA